MNKIKLIDLKNKAKQLEVNIGIIEQLFETDKCLYSPNRSESAFIYNGIVLYSTNTNSNYPKLKFVNGKYYLNYSLVREQTIKHNNQKFKIYIHYLPKSNKPLASVHYYSSKIKYRLNFNHQLLNMIDKNNYLGKVINKIYKLYLKYECFVDQKDLKKLPQKLANKIKIHQTFK